MPTINTGEARPRFWTEHNFAKDERDDNIVQIVQCDACPDEYVRHVMSATASVAEINEVNSVLSNLFNIHAVAEHRAPVSLLIDLDWSAEVKAKAFDPDGAYKWSNNW